MKKTRWLTYAAVSCYSETKADFESPVLSVSAMDSRIQISSDAIQFGFSVFEGMRAYVVDNDYIVFRSRDHHERLMRSCAGLDMPCPSYDTFIEAIRLVIERNCDEAERGFLYIRPLVFSTSGGIMAQQDRSFAYAVLCAAQGVANGNIKVFVETKNPRTVPAFASIKTASNYANAGLINQKAQSKGYDTVLWLDGNGNVQECTTMNIFFCTAEGEISTPRLGSILPGITRRTMIELLRDQGCEVTERDLPIGEIVDSIRNDTMSYVFTTSTGLGISRVTHLTHLEQEYTIAGKCPARVEAAIRDYRLVTAEFPVGLAAHHGLQERSYLGRLSPVATSVGDKVY